MRIGNEALRCTSTKRLGGDAPDERSKRTVLNDSLLGYLYFT